MYVIPIANHLPVGKPVLTSDDLNNLVLSSITKTKVGKTWEEGESVPIKLSFGFKNSNLSIRRLIRKIFAC